MKRNTALIGITLILAAVSVPAFIKNQNTTVDPTLLYEIRELKAMALDVQKNQDAQVKLGVATHNKVVELEAKHKPVILPEVR